MNIVNIVNSVIALCFSKVFTFFNVVVAMSTMVQTCIYITHFLFLVIYKLFLATFTPCGHLVAKLKKLLVFQ